MILFKGKYLKCECPGSNLTRLRLLIHGSVPENAISFTNATDVPEKSAYRKRRLNMPKTPVVSMGRRNTQLRPTFIENKN